MDSIMKGYLCVFKVFKKNKVIIGLRVNKITF